MAQHLRQELLQCLNTGLPCPLQDQPLAILATATDDDLAKHEKRDLQHIIGLAREQGTVVRLRIVPGQARPRLHQKISLLESLADLPGFETLKREWHIQNVRCGDEWRALGMGQSSSGVDALERLLNTCNNTVTHNGKHGCDLDESLQLTVHPQGNAALVLARIPPGHHDAALHVARDCSSITAAGTATMTCRLCEKDWADPTTPCLFHPGRKFWSGDGESDSEASEDEDDLAHNEVCHWTCCGRRGNFSGCTADVSHIYIARSELVGNKAAMSWRDSWQQ